MHQDVMAFHNKKACSMCLPLCIRLKNASEAIVIRKNGTKYHRNSSSSGRIIAGHSPFRELSQVASPLFITPVRGKK